MNGKLRIAICLLGLTTLAGLAGCRPRTKPVLDPAGVALLRLEYLERASQLPALNIDRIDIPQEDHLGRFSSIVWRIRSELAPGREIYRPLPIGDVDLRLRRSLLRTMEDFGFNMRGWTQMPRLRLRVEVEKLVLLSEEGAQGRRACDLSLLIRIEEHPSGLEIERFRSTARWELPGSWTVMRGGEAHWLPGGLEEDPIVQAATVAGRRFLQESLEFWRCPSRWEDGGVNLSDASLR